MVQYCHNIVDVLYLEDGNIYGPILTNQTTTMFFSQKTFSSVFKCGIFGMNNNHFLYTGRPEDAILHPGTIKKHGSIEPFYAWIATAALMILIVIITTSLCLVIRRTR